MGWWETLNEWLGKGVILADPTRGNVVATRALPWLGQNVIDPFSAMVLRPLREGQGNVDWGSRASWAGGPLGAAIYERFKPGAMKEFYEWKAPSTRVLGMPIGVKGAAELLHPINLVGGGVGPQIAGKGLMRAGGALATRGMYGPAKAINLAGRGSMALGRGVTMLEEAPTRLAGAGLRQVTKRVLPAKVPAAALGTVGTSVTPKGLRVAGAMAGGEVGRTWWPFKKAENLDDLRVFVTSRDKTEYPEFLSPYQPEELMGHQVFLSESGNAGYILSQEGDLGNVFNNRHLPGGLAGEGAWAVVDGISRGARTLDCYDGRLPKYYAKFGFKETGRAAFDPKYKHPKWDVAKRGTPEVIFMEYAGGTRNVDDIVRSAEAAGIQFPARGGGEAPGLYAGAPEGPLGGMGPRAPGAPEGGVGVYGQPGRVGYGTIGGPAEGVTGQFAGTTTGTLTGTPYAVPRGTAPPGTPTSPVSGRSLEGLVNWQATAANTLLKGLRPLRQLMLTEFPADTLARAATKSRAARALIAKLDPRRTSSTDIQKLTTSYMMSEFQAELMGDMAKAILDAKEPQKLFGYSPNDLKPKLVTPKDPAVTGDYIIHDVYRNPSQFNLTPQQADYINLFHTIAQEKEVLERAAALKVRHKALGPDEYWVPSHAAAARQQRNPFTGEVKALRKGQEPDMGWELTTEIRQTKMRGKPEKYRTKAVGEEAGIIYDTPEQSMKVVVTETYKDAVTKELMETVDAMAREAGYKITPKERVPTNVATAFQQTEARLAGLKYIVRQIQDAMAHKKLSGSALAAIERRAPQYAARLRDILRIPTETFEKKMAAIEKSVWDAIEVNVDDLARATSTAAREGRAAIGATRAATKLTKDDFVSAVRVAQTARIEKTIRSLWNKEEYANFLPMNQNTITPNDIIQAVKALNIKADDATKLVQEAWEKAGDWRTSDVAIARVRMKGLKAATQEGMKRALDAERLARRQQNTLLKQLRNDVIREYNAVTGAFGPIEQAYGLELAKAKIPTRAEVEVRGKIYPKELGEPISAALYGNKANATLKALEHGVGAFRTLQTGFDLGVQTLHLLPLLFYKPKAWGRASAMMFQGLGDLEALSKFATSPEHIQATQELASLGVSVVGRPAELVTGAARGEVLERISSKIPILGKARIPERAQSSFTGALGAAKILTWEAIRDRALVNGVLDPELGARWAAHLRNVTGTLETRMLGIPANQRAVENAILFYASRYTRAGFALMDDAIRGRVTRGQSLRALGSLAAGSMGMYLAMSAALGQTPQLDPRKPGRFMTVRIGNSRVGFGGFHSALLRFMISSAAQPGEIINPDDWQDGTLAKFIRGRASIPTTVGWDVLSRRTIMGEPIEDMGDFTKHEILARALPFWASDYVTQTPTPGIEEFPAQMFGLRSFVRSYAEQRDALRNQYGIRDYGGRWDELNKLQQQQLEADYPDLEELTTLAEQRYAKTGGPKAQEWSSYKAEVKRINTWVADKLQTLDKGYNTGQITPSELRLMTSEVYSQARAMKTLLEGDDRFKSVMAYFGRPDENVTKNLRSEDVAFNEYASLLFSDSMVDEYGRYDYNKAERLKKSIRAKYGAEAYQYIQERLQFGKEEPASIRAMRRAQQTLKPYWQVEDVMWRRMAPQLKRVNLIIERLEATDPDKARAMLKQYPMIVKVRQAIAAEKKRLRTVNPAIERALLFYR